MISLIAGFALIVAGVLGMAGRFPLVGNYTYAVTWWGILTLIDEWNFRRRGLSLWRGHAARFAFVTLPLSVVFWLFFEMLNLGSPQWRYRGGLPNLSAQVLFGFVSFGTVIPIMIEIYWVIGGEFRLPRAAANTLKRHSGILALIGVALTLLPYFNHEFWLNQGMWIAPALLLLRLAPLPVGSPSAARLALNVAANGIVAGLMWESLNWFSPTHWEYLILQSWPHLFQMPWIGYIGFIPFAFTALLVYSFAERIPANARAGAVLYAIAFAGLYLLTVIYDRRGLWMAG